MVPMAIETVDIVVVVVVAAAAAVLFQSYNIMLYCSGRFVFHEKYGRHICHCRKYLCLLVVCGCVFVVVVALILLDYRRPSSKSL
jgi:uncharacterized membrane protein